MVRSVYIMSVIDIDIACMIIVEPIMVVIYVHTTQSIYPVVPITNINIPNLGYPTIVIIINRYILNLYDSTIIIVLCIRTIIISRIECDTVFTARHIIIDIKIKLSIGIY